MVDENVAIDDIISAIEDDEVMDALRRKNAYMEERKRALGTEYYSSKDQPLKAISFHLVELKGVQKEKKD